MGKVNTTSLSGQRNAKHHQQQQQRKNSAATDLSSFSLAAAISQVSSSPQQQHTQLQLPRKIFNNIGSSISQQSIATNASFVTANESAPLSTHANNGTITPASHYVDSSDDETDDQGLNYSNDPLAVLSRTESGTPTEISFASSCSNPEETMPSKKSSKIDPVVEATPAPAPAPAAAEVATKKEPQAAPATAVTKNAEEEAHFDVAQTVYGAAKDVWAWGRTVPVLTNLLGITEAVAAKVLDTTVHMDLPAIDEKGVTPQLKRLDDDLITPVVLAVWKIIAPAVAKGEEMVVKPVMREVVPRVLAPLGMFGDKKEEDKVDASRTPEVVPALN